MNNKKIQKEKREVIRDDDYLIETKRYLTVIPAIVHAFVSYTITQKNKLK